MKRYGELELDRQFANVVLESSVFRSWLLSRTRFVEHAALFDLLHEEQLIRHPNGYAKHWWCRVPKAELETVLIDVPETGKDRETDIFLVFQHRETKARFALHIENKPPQGKFLPGQAESYNPRGRHMMNKIKYLNYSDFETIIIAPQKFLDSDLRCRYFDRQISYEDVAPYVSSFSLISQD